MKAWHTNFPLYAMSFFRITHHSHWPPLVIRGAPPSLSQPFLLFSHLLSYLPFFGYTAHEKEGLARTLAFSKSGLGYMAIQSTKPQTLGYGLTDSPVGLLAWIYDGLVGWTDAYPWEDDEGLFSTLFLENNQTLICTCISVDLGLCVPVLACWTRRFVAHLL